MGQMGFFDIANRYAGLDAKNDPLVKIDEVVPWEDFRPRLEAAWRKPAEDRKSPAGRKPWDALVMFKAIVLCALYNLSDDQVEYQLRDRLSFMRFLGLGLEDRVPDAKTVWLYREHLAQAGVIEALFDAFDGSLKKRGYLAMGGQIIDASIVPVPQQRNSRDENARIKDGETPEGWEKQPAKRRQKDTDARWTKKHGKSHYGYKNHVNVDRRHKLVRRYQVTDAAVHDSQVVEDILDADNTASDVWADSAYRSAEIEAKLGEKGSSAERAQGAGPEGYGPTWSRQRHGRARRMTSAALTRALVRGIGLPRQPARHPRRATHPPPARPHPPARRRLTARPFAPVTCFCPANCPFKGNQPTHRSGHQRHREIGAAGPGCGLVRFHERGRCAMRLRRGFPAMRRWRGAGSVGPSAPPAWGPRGRGCRPGRAAPARRRRPRPGPRFRSRG